MLTDAGRRLAQVDARIREHNRHTGSINIRIRSSRMAQADGLASGHHPWIPNGLSRIANFRGRHPSAGQRGYYLRRGPGAREIADHTVHLGNMLNTSVA